MIRSSLCDYSDKYIYVKGIIIVPSTTATDASPNSGNREVILKSCVLFTNCMDQKIDAQVEDADDIDVVMP